MITQRIQFQQETIRELTDYTLDLLSKSRGRRICTFRSPTGSGKTIMMATAISWIAQTEKEFELCFIWLSIGTGGLIHQSFKKVNSLIGKKLKCVTLEDKLKGNPIIEGNEILFTNWEKINSTINKARKGGDLPNILDLMHNTKRKTKVVLIIDESHRSANTEKANMVRDIISPDVTIEMSATPSLNVLDKELYENTCHLVSVEPPKVIKSGLIKKEIIINENLKETSTDESTGLGVVLEAAYNKRVELLKAILKEDSNINPLVLVQIPNADEGADRITFIESFLAERDITYENGKLAKILSGDHKNVENIEKGNNKIEFIIFKQAIAVGWDCPRAYVLVKFRDVGNEVFEIQTIGRILRMPDAFHYKNDILNVGYVYTTINNIKINIEKSYYPNLIKHLRAKLQIQNSPVLTSFYRQRFYSNDITDSFKQILVEIWKKELGIGNDFLYINVLKKIETFGFDTSGTRLKTSLLSNISIDIPYTIDDLSGNYTSHAESEYSVLLSDIDTFYLFNKVILNNVEEFATKRSLPAIRLSLYNFFNCMLGTYYRDMGKELYVKRILLSNIKTFGSLLHKTIEAYRPLRNNEFLTKLQEYNYGELSIDWVLGKDLYYPPTYESIKHKLYAFKPCYLRKDRSKLEKDFECYIDLKSDLIKWWYKNGDNGKEHFAIKYIENGKTKSFYPDYIVQMTNGNIGIFDTKSGLTAKSATDKAEALTEYTTIHFDVTGGVVVPYKNNWMVHRADKYHYDENKFDGWDTIEDVLSKDKTVYIIDK